MAAVLVTDDTMLDAPAWNADDISFFNQLISIQMPIKAPTIIIKGIPIPKNRFVYSWTNEYVHKPSFSDKF